MIYFCICDGEKGRKTHKMVGSHGKLKLFNILPCSFRECGGETWKLCSGRLLKASQEMLKQCANEHPKRSSGIGLKKKKKVINLLG